MHKRRYVWHVDRLPMTSRFRALIRTSLVFAAAGIPVGIAQALLAAWQAPQHLRNGIGYWSLATGFAIDSVRMCMIIFALVGLVFGLWLSVAGLPVTRRRAMGRGTWLGALAGVLSGVAAYAFGGWGAGESIGTWLAGAASLGALNAALGGALAAAYFKVAASASPAAVSSGHPPALLPGGE